MAYAGHNAQITMDLTEPDAIGVTFKLTTITTTQWQIIVRRRMHEVTPKGVPAAHFAPGLHTWLCQCQGIWVSPYKEWLNKKPLQVYFVRDAVNEWANRGLGYGEWERLEFITDVDSACRWRGIIRLNGPVTWLP